jgi:hypothetical protein
MARNLRYGARFAPGIVYVRPHVGQISLTETKPTPACCTLCGREFKATDRLLRVGKSRAPVHFECATITSEEVG